VIGFVWGGFWALCSFGATGVIGTKSSLGGRSGTVALFGQGSQEWMGLELGSFGASGAGASARQAGRRNVRDPKERQR
jgi:hypothetical protein